MSQGLPSYIILQALESALAALLAAATPPGTVIVASEPAEAQELLGNAPQSWRVIIGVDDEDAEPDSEDRSNTGLSRTEIFAIVQAPVGLPKTAGKQIHRSGTAGAPSILEYAEAVRCMIRGLSFSHDGLPSGCHFTFAWRRSTWATKQEEGRPPQFARQHVFACVHQTATPAQLEAQTLTWP